MEFFTNDTILPLLRFIKAQSVLEVGASYGGNTNALLANTGLKMTVVDPCLDADLGLLFGGRIELHRGLSLEVLPRLGMEFDAILLDGDHNWYTVFNELLLIEQFGLLKKKGFVFLHDVGWPYGRRDMYYLPDTIPKEFRHPFSKKGLERGNPRLVENEFNAGFSNADMEGGPRNGVLTAVEDYVAHTSGRFLKFIDYRQHGLGILIRREESEVVAEVRKLLFRRQYVEPLADKANNIKAFAKQTKVARALRTVRNWLRQRPLR